MTPKYAPAREDGDKLYVVTRGGWGRWEDRIGWGTTPTEAKWDAWGRLGTGHYISKCRRATPEDM